MHSPTHNQPKIPAIEVTAAGTPKKAKAYYTRLIDRSTLAVQPGHSTHLRFKRKTHRFKRLVLHNDSYLRGSLLVAYPFSKKNAAMPAHESGSSCLIKLFEVSSADGHGNEMRAKRRVTVQIAKLKTARQSDNALLMS